MSDSPFQEKPNWKGKIDQIKESLTRFMSKRQTSDTSPHISDEETNQAREPWPKGEQPVGGSLSDSPRDDRTLTGMIKAQWNERVVPGFQQAFTARFGRKNKGGGPSSAMTADTYNFFALVIAILLVTYIGADLSALFIEKLIPDAPQSRGSRFGGDSRPMKNISDYQAILTRNLFNSRGLIPGDDIPGTQDQNNEPVKTTLPLNLIGTVILKNELRSIATIEDRDAQMVFPVRVDDEIPGKARILSIEAYKVIFTNPNTGRREFVDLPEDLNANPISLGAPRSAKSANLGGGIEQTAPTQFNLPRPEIDKALANMNEVLTQARAIPHTENGMPAGYKLIQIVPGSIYSKLGLENGDILCGLNGEPINDPGKAWELLGQLKTASRMELCVKRGGRTSNNVYDIR